MSPERLFSSVGCGSEELDGKKTGREHVYIIYSIISSIKFAIVLPDDRVELAEFCIAGIGWNFARMFVY